MSGYRAFVKKEWLEGIRTYKLVLILSAFFILGLMSPFTAKLMPQILGSLEQEGMKIQLPDPAAIDSWTQFYKNITGLGLIVVAILYSGLMANEYAKKTMIPMLTKGLKRSDMILAKFTMASAEWTSAYWLAYGITYVYTAFYWDQSKLTHLLVTAVFVWIAGEVLITMLLFGGTLIRNQYGSLLFSACILAVLYLLQIVPKIAEYNPIRLISDNRDLLIGKTELSEMMIPTLLAVGCMIVFLAGSIVIFNRKDINE